MEKIFEIREYILKYYAKYSRYVDFVFRFLLALVTFVFVSNHVGFIEMLSNPAVILGLSVVCTFLPRSMTALIASAIVIVEFLVVTPGIAIVSSIVFLVMFALYFRFAPGKSIVLLLTPIGFTIGLPILIPIIFGLIGGTISIIPITFGTIVYYMLTHVKAYASIIETVSESGIMGQITSFTQQLLSNKEMWMTILAFAICVLLVHSIRRLAIDYAWEIAVGSGVLVYIIMMTFGHVMMDINISYGILIAGSVVSALVALIFKFIVFSVDYTRTEHLQFEDDEYYYYVKAVPKVSVAVPEKTVKKINVRQETSVMDTEAVKKALPVNTEVISEEKKLQEQIEESEIQKIIEEELKR